MTTTNILLTLIAVLLAVRIVLQLRQGKRELKHYCAPSEVENCVIMMENNHYDVSNAVERMASYKWEFVSPIPTEKGKLLLFFTRKKIKNYYEE